MAGRAPFPDRHVHFDDYISIAIPYLDTNASRLKIEPSDITQLNNYFTDWKIIFPLSENKAVRTHTISLERNQQRAQIEKLMRQIYNDIPRSRLNTEDRLALKLKTRGPGKGRHGKPASAPVGRVDKMMHLQHVLRITDPLRPDTQAKPKGVKFIEVWLALVDTATISFGSVPPASAFKHQLTTGRFLSRIDFHLDEVGKTAFYFTRWLNSRGEAGPQSEVFSAVVG